MSSCIVLQQKNNIFIASDTAISSNVSGKIVRLSNNAEKVFAKKDGIVFCSGNMEVANKCKKSIKQMEFLNIEEIQKIVSSFYVDGMFEVFVAKTNGEVVESYQLSSYNNFNPIKRVVCNDNAEIFALGYNVYNMLNDFENNLMCNDILSSIKKTFNENICIEVGGSVDVCYFYSGNMHQLQYKLDDSTRCISSTIFESECSFVIANNLYGKVILGNQLYIGNENNTVVINPNGISIHDPNATQEERIFLGIRDGKAKLELHSASGNNKLVLSENGIYQVFPVQARDSFDRYNSFKVPFYLPQSLQRLDEAKLILNLDKFRAYSKSMKAHPESSSTSTSASGGGGTSASGGGGTSASGGGGTSGAGGITSVSGGGTTSRSGGGGTSGNGGYYSTTRGTRMTAATNNWRETGRAITSQVDLQAAFYDHIHQIDEGILLHEHEVKIEIPNHTHSVPAHSHIIPDHTHTMKEHSHTIPDHKHTIPDHKHTIPDHKHDVTITIPAHTHDIEYGIYEYPTLPTVRVLLDGVVIADNVTTNQNIDLSNRFTFLGGTHTIEIQSLSKTGNANGLGRAAIDLFVSGFVAY